MQHLYSRILKSVALFCLHCIVVTTICVYIPCAHAALQYDHVLVLSLGLIMLDITVKLDCFATTSCCRVVAGILVHFDISREQTVCKAAWLKDSTQAKVRGYRPQTWSYFLLCPLSSPDPLTLRLCVNNSSESIESAGELPNLIWVISQRSFLRPAAVSHLSLPLLDLGHFTKIAVAANLSAHLRSSSTRDA